MASQVAICNLALLKFGSTTITSITEDTREARACHALWELVRDDLLYSYPWKFALTRYTMGTPLTADPEFEYNYQYTLPADCLRVYEMYDSDEEWTVERGVLLSNRNSADDDIYIRYIAKITDVSKYHPAFVKCLATALAAELAVKLKDDAKLRLSYLQELETYVARAYKLDAIEGEPAKHKSEQDLTQGNYSWQTEGR